MTGNELLWQGGQKTGNLDFSSAIENLELERLGALLFQGMTGPEAVCFIKNLVTDDWASIKMRQDVISDLLRSPRLADLFRQLLRLSEEISFYAQGIRDNAAGLRIDRMDAMIDSLKKKIINVEKLVDQQGGDEMDKLKTGNRYAMLLRSVVFKYELFKRYCAALTLLRDAFSETIVQSAALRALKAWSETQVTLDNLDGLRARLKDISGWWKGIEAFSIDVCMDGRMQMSSLEVAELRAMPYEKNGMLDGDPREPRDGITGLIQFPQSGSGAPYLEYLLNEIGFEARKELTKLRSELKWTITGQDDLISMQDAFRFFLAAADFASRLIRRGVPVCTPEVSDTAVLDAENAVSPEQALTGPTLPVANDLSLGADGFFSLITGPNSSGKTCYLILAGQLIWLAQLGCLLPCARASLRPCDSLLTLFATGESEEGEDSRMGMEVIKLKEITECMTNRSFVLLNEPMTGTSAKEGISICIDLISALISNGVSGMMVTHFVDIAALLDERLDRDGIKGRVKSLVMTTGAAGGEITYLYKVTEAPPMASSRARAVIGKLGVTLADMLRRMDELGMDVRPEDPAWETIGRGEVL